MIVAGGQITWQFFFGLVSLSGRLGFLFFILADGLLLQCPI
jgi:hypothetical protein